MAKLLLVEDDNNLREIYEARLTAEGYDIVTAQNGEEALSVAKQHKPDLIISDVMMPRISGFEMLDILRNTDELKNTKIIMLTALGQTEDRGRADNLGADKYLVKSQVTLEDIVNAAKALLADEPGSITTPTAAPVIPDPISQPAAVITAAATEPTNETENLASPIASPLDQSTQPITDAATATVLPPNPAPVSTPTGTIPVAPQSEATTTFTAPQTTPQAAPQPIAAAATPPTTTDTQQSTPVMSTAQLTDDVAANTPVPVASATVTVADPDPIATHISPPAELLDSSEPSVATATGTTPTVAAAAAPSVPSSPEAPTQVVSASNETKPTESPLTLAAEEAAIEAQIASFAASDQSSTASASAPINPAPETVPAPTSPSEANDSVLADAVQKLSDTQPELSVVRPPSEANTTKTLQNNSNTELANATQEPAQDVSEDTTTTPENTDNINPQVAGHKIIQPISDVETGTPDLEVLLAKEEAKEAAAGAANPQPVIMGEDTDDYNDDNYDENDEVDEEEQQSSVDPNTIAL